MRRFPFADEVVVSPDGRHIAFQEGDNVYVTPFPLSRSGGEPVHITKRGGALPVEQLSTEGGLFPTWIDPDRLSFGSAQRIYVHDLTTSATDTTDVSLRVPRALSTRSIALTNARIVTLEDEAQPNGAAGVLERGVVLIEGARIACVGLPGACETASRRHRDRLVGENHHSRSGRHACPPLPRTPGRHSGGTRSSRPSIWPMA